MKMINNKKAKVFSLFLVFTTLIVSGFVLFAFIAENVKNVPKFTIQNQLSEFYMQQDSFKFYTKESATIYSLQAYSDLIETFKFAGSSCKIEGEYIEFCSVASTSDIKDNFKTYLMQNFKTSVLNYPSSEFNSISYDLQIDNQHNQLEFTAPKKQRELTTADYSAKVDFDPSFSIDFNEIYSGTISLDFQEIYDLAMQCKAKATEQEIIDCMKFKDYATTIKIDSGKVFFDLTSPYSSLKDSSGTLKQKKIIIKFYVLK